MTVIMRSFNICTEISKPNRQRGRLYSVYLCFIIVFLFIQSSYGDYRYSDDCLSIKGKLGTCIPLNSCPLFSSWLKQRPLVKENLRLLVRYTCFFDTNNPKVCCPNDDFKGSSEFIQNEEEGPEEIGVRIGDYHSSNSKISNKLSFTFPSTPSSKKITKNENDASDKITFSIKQEQHVALAFPTESTRAKAFQTHKSTSTEGLRQHPNFRLIPEMHDCSNAVKLDSLLGTYAAFPWIALVGVKRRQSLDFDHVCAGAVINDRYIVTAAHCFDHAKPKYVRLGEYDLDTLIDQGSEYLPQSRREDFRIEKSTPHPEFSKITYANDIALIRVDRPIALNTTFIKSVCLPFVKEYDIESRLNVKDLKALEGKAAWTAGWSRHSWDGVYSKGSSGSVLNESIVEFSPRENCRFHYPQRSSLNTQICVGGDKRRNSCTADSGGPLMYPLRVPSRVPGFVEPKFFMLGLLSHGPTGSMCQNVDDEGRSLPSNVFTRISKYLSWILDNMQE